VVSPILLRTDPDHPGRYLIITGERRYLASQRARRTTVPALIREVEAATLLLLQLIENVQRVDLRPEETARALESILASTPELKQSRLATLLGKSPTWVSQHLALLHYEGPTHEALAENLLQSPETARRFDQLSEENRQQLLAEARASGNPITRTAVAAALPVAPEAPPEPLPAKKTGRPPKEKTIPLPAVTPSQLALLFAALDLGSVPRTQAEVWEVFLARLNP
jgi:ParB family transcriptional regulator, chromosome partitioning protein